MQQPVLLDIWAPWCGPCKALGPVLEKLEAAYAGRFTLAKLNSDEQPDIAGQLSQMFGVRSIPFCVLFKGGQPVDGFVGALPESEMRAFLDSHVPSAESRGRGRRVEEAEALLAEGDTDSALERLQEARGHQPGATTPRATTTCGPCSSAAQIDEARAGLRAGRRARSLLDPRLARCGHWLAALRAVGAGRAQPTSSPRRSPPTSATSTPASSWRSATSRRSASRRRWTSCSRS